MGVRCHGGACLPGSQVGGGDRRQRAARHQAVQSRQQALAGRRAGSRSCGSQCCQAAVGTPPARLALNRRTCACCRKNSKPTEPSHSVLRSSRFCARRRLRRSRLAASASEEQWVEALAPPLPPLRECAPRAAAAACQAAARGSRPASCCRRRAASMGLAGVGRWGRWVGVGQRWGPWVRARGPWGGLYRIGGVTAGVGNARMRARGCPVPAFRRS